MFKKMGPITREDGFLGMENTSLVSLWPIIFHLCDAAGRGGMRVGRCGGGAFGQQVHYFLYNRIFKFVLYFLIHNLKQSLLIHK